MTGQPMLDVFEAPPEAIVPVCDVCGASGERIVVGEPGVPRLDAAASWALVAIAEHKREMHSGRRLVCSCGWLLGRVRGGEHAAGDEAGLWAATEEHRAAAGCTALWQGGDVA